MWYYLPEWLKWFKGKPKPTPEEQSFSEMIKRRAEEQKAVIENLPEKGHNGPAAPAAVEKDFFE
jgi:hypothetical protein